MKTHVVTMGFAPARILEQGIARFYETHDKDLPVQHFIVDQHYPLHREENRARIEKLCISHNITLLDPGRDMGLHNGLNWAAHQINPSDDDVWIGYDPDSWPMEYGWDYELVHAIRNRGYSVMGLINSVIHGELMSRGYRMDHMENNEPTIIECTLQPCILSISAWSCAFLRAVGGFWEPNAFYGGIESGMWPKLKALGGRLGYLQDFHESDRLNHEHDPEYRSWKWNHAHYGRWPGDFKSYVEAGCPFPVPK